MGPDLPMAETSGEGVGNGGGAAGETTSSVVYKKGAWSKEEDEKLRKAVGEYGLRNWVTIEKFSGLARPAKNCRLRWLNYLRPNLKKYPFTPEEEKLILQLHAKYGNSWSRIAAKLPGRSDNEIKNFWHKRAKKCQKHHLPIYPDMQENQINASNSNIQDSHCVDEVNAASAASNNEYFPSYDNIPTNYPNNHSLPSTSIHSSPEFQPNNASHQTDAPPQPQTLLSPSTITTSHGQSPTNHSVDQTALLPSSQTQNLFVSPHRTEVNPVLIPGTAAPSHIQPPSMWQGDAASNSFITLRAPPVLSFPQGYLRRFSRAMSQLPPTAQFMSGSSHSPANASTFLLPADSSVPVQWSSAMDSSRLPQKLKLPPGVPTVYSVQTSTQMTESSVASFLLNSPTTPLSPAKWRLSIPVPSDSCFQSNASIPNSSTAAVPLPSSPLNPSSRGQDLPPVLPMKVDTDKVVPMDSSHNIETVPPSIQFNPAATSGADSSMHEVESDSNSEILDELREAEARVRFLKKKLRQGSNYSNKRTLLIDTSRKKVSFNGSPETNDLHGRVLRAEVPLDRNSSQITTREGLLTTSSGTKNFLGDVFLMVNAPPGNSRTKVMLKRQKSDLIGISKATLFRVRSAENMHQLHRRDDSDSGEYTEESIESEQVTRSEDSGPQTFLEGSSQREEHSLNGETFKKQKLSTSQEQRHSSDAFNHINSQNRMNASNADLLDHELCPSQFLAGKCLKECSTMEDVFSQSSTVLQDSYLKGDLFDQRSGIEDPLSSQRHAPAFVPIYSQSTATTLVKPNNEGRQLSYLQSDGGYFGDSFGQEFSDNGLMGATTTATSMLCEANRLQQEYPEASLQESGNLLSKSIMEHESLVVEQFPVRTSGGGNSAESMKLDESSLLLHQYAEANLLDSNFLVDGFEHEYPTGEQHTAPTSAANGFFGGDAKPECTSRETWKQEPSQQHSSMDGLLIEHLWPETQMVSQDQALLISTPDSAVNPSAMTQLMDQPGHGNAGEIPKQEQEEEGHMSTMSEELSSLLEFFPTSFQTLEWINNGNAIEGSDEFDRGLGFHSSSPSNQLMTIADHI